jgi:hypothetical protein
MKTLATLALLLFSAAVSSTAHASEHGFYIGGYYGLTSKESNRGFFELLTTDIHGLFDYTPGSAPRNSFDDQDSAFALIAGYQLTSYLAFEGAYTRLGQVTFRSRSTGNFPMDTGFLNVNIESETSGFEVSVLGTLPLSRNWQLFGRAGALIATNQLKVVISAQGDVFLSPSGGQVSDSFSRSTTDAFAAVGISRRFFEIYDIRLEYQRIFDAGLEVTGGQGDLDAALIGLTVSF